MAPRARRLRRRGAALAAALVLGGTACAGPRAAPELAPGGDPLALLAEGPDAPRPSLAMLLAAHPLGDAPFRADLVSATSERTAYLVQTRRGIPPHFHRTHVERAWVLAGSGTFQQGAAASPAREGAAFVVPAGTVHAAACDPGSTLVVLAVFEPPMASIDEDRVRVGG